MYDNNYADKPPTEEDELMQCHSEDREDNEIYSREALYSFIISRNLITEFQEMYKFWNSDELPF